MKRYRNVILTFMIILLVLVSFPMKIYSNAAEPPSFTIIVTNPPEDLSLSLMFEEDVQREAIELDKEKKAWETYYRFFYGMVPGIRDNLDNGKLIVESREKSFQVSVPLETFSMYNNILTLDMDTESLIMGQSPMRVPILIALRLVLTLLIEGSIFFIFGYRQRRSWIIFLVINLITQGGLNAMINGPGIGSYWIFGFVFAEIIILIVEMITFTSMVKEHKKDRNAIYTITANLASLVLGGLLITYLPV